MTTPSLRFSDDVSLFILDDAGIVFSASAQEIYELNAAATWIWCQLEDARETDGLSQGLASTFGFSQAEARQHLSEIIAAWRELGFFDRRRSKRVEVEDAAAPSEGKSTLDAPSRLTKALKRRLSRQGDGGPLLTYRTSARDVAVLFPSTAMAELVHPAIAHIYLTDQPPPPGLALIEIERKGERYRISLDGVESLSSAAETEVTPIVQYLVYVADIEHRDYSVAFHAGAVALDGRVAVLPGQAGNGKTSLTAALIASGLQYLSDDLLLMSEDLEIEGIPFALCIKAGGTKPIAQYYPEIDTLALHHRGDGKRVRYLLPPRQSFRMGPPAKLPASWVIFPKYRQDSQTRLTPLGKSEALRRLMQSCTLALPLEKDQIRTFIRWLEEVDCYDLEVTSLAESVTAVKSLMGQGSRI